MGVKIFSKKLILIVISLIIISLASQLFSREIPKMNREVVLISFTAQFIGNLPIICWTTQSETNNAGWNIYRGEHEDALNNGDAIQLNLATGLIPGAGTTTEPTIYVFEDQCNVISGNEYWYWLESVDYLGETEIHGPISFTIPVAADENNLTNSGNQLLQNYPNPFNPSGAGRSPSTTISFLITNDSNVELVIYNIKGQKVKTVVDDNKFDKGNYSVIWNGNDDSGKSVSSGVYFYKLNVNNKTEAVKKCLLLK